MLLPSSTFSASMNNSAPCFSDLIDGTSVTSPSHASGCLTSDARPTNSNLDSESPFHNSCSNCFSYHCKSDDENFLRAMGEESDDYRRRVEWIWYCIYEAAPQANSSDREQIWRTLVESDDIWSIWEDGDELSLPVMPTLGMPSAEQPEHDVWNSITPIMSQKIDRHSKNRCSPKLIPSSSPASQNTSVQMRLAIVLWKTLLATRCVKYPHNPSSVNREIPSLIPQWWDMLPKLVKDNLVVDDPYFWHRFRTEQKRRGHTCIKNLPREEMWSAWITVQSLIGTPIPLDMPLDDENCPQCLTLQEQPFGRSEFVKPHVLALWLITRATCGWFGHLHSYPSNIWDGNCRIFSHHTSWYKDLNIRKSLFSQVTLHKVDEWLTDIWSNSNDESDSSEFRRHVGKSLNHIPQQLKKYLKWNENNLDPYWTETQVAISKISSSKSSVDSESNSTEPASWVSAVVLGTLANIYGLGPLAAQRFVETEEPCVQYLLEKAPLLSDTPASKKFHEALKRSGHTCWSEKSSGLNSSTNLYFSAYSLLLDTSDVPVVGCEERKCWTQCTACQAKSAFHDLSLVLDDELLGPLESLSDKDKDGRMKTLISNLNCLQYQKDDSTPLPLNGVDLTTLTKKLNSLSNLFQLLLDNGKDMNLFDPDEISLRDSPTNKDSYDSKIDPEYTQSSDHSTPGSSAQLPQPVSDHENDAPNFENLEAIWPSHSAFEKDSSPTDQDTSAILSTSTQGSSQIQHSISADQTTLVNPHPPSHTYALPPESTSDLQPLPPSQPPIMNQQPWVDYTIQSHSGIIGSADLLTMPHLTPQEIRNEQADIQESGDSTQRMQQIGVSPNASNIPNPSFININRSPLPVLEEKTFEKPFITETGMAHNTKPPRQPRVDRMRIEIKKRLISMLESKKIRITGGKLPWRNLFKILQEHECEFENWPVDTPKPSTQNGIEKAPQYEIKAIYKALFDKERPLRIRRIQIDGQSGGADQIIIPHPLSGKKRSRDDSEQGEVKERESNRRRLGMY
ncbi:hypothetical protein K435DRAFT_859048 [Dendrothele bispora CBS 962.96]|uniref:Uncharacterized protein n=1 Tax=Dendrothele bispora (strain CBS 962.96) TaxID=1314807 RepID=A0A4S8M1K0_DENBC|nr:hypothetical protein K435DRAFT_859048 [Dendrothele bispora CBS 962.96]